MQLAMIKLEFVEKIKSLSSIPKRESTEALKPRRKVKEANIKASYKKTNLLNKQAIL